MAALVAVSGMAQIKLGKDVNLKIYGHVRTDIYYNSRDNVTLREHSPIVTPR